MIIPKYLLKISLILILLLSSAFAECGCKKRPLEDDKQEEGKDEETPPTITPITDAMIERARKGKKEFLAKKLEALKKGVNGVDVNQADISNLGFISLHYAAELGGDIDITQALLDRGADKDAKDNDGKSPLHWAVEKGNVEIVKVLLAANADTEAKDNNGKIPLDLATDPAVIALLRKPPTIAPITDEMIERARKVEIFEMEFLANKLEALKKGEKVDISPIDEESPTLHYTALHMAAILGGDADIVKTLLDRKAAMNYSRNPGGETPIYYATIYGNLEVVKALITAGADVNKGNYVLTPLHGSNGNVEIAKALLKAGANPNALDNAGRFPLHYAAARGYVEVVKELLLDERVNKDAQSNNKNTPLHEAATSGHLEVVKVLLEAKANPNATNSLGKNPLHYAVQKSVVEVVEKLIKAEATINAKDNDGKTPLHYAVTGSPQIVKALLDNGADKTALDNSNFTPLSMVKALDSPEKYQAIIELLSKP